MNRFILMCGAVAAFGACKKTEPAKTDPAHEEKAVEAMKPKAPEAPAVDPKLVERGAYVAKASGCMTCHVGLGPTGPDLAHPGAGGLEIADPVGGTWRSPNITPDKGTGIGNWTDDQIGRAIREGIRPDGTLLYVIMPYQNFNRMTDDDAKALVAFLRTLKPVDRTVAPNKDLKFPKVPTTKPTNAPDDASNPLKHGEYLATLMLCSHCHWTPDAHMAPAGPDKMFSGGLDMTIPMFGSGKLYSRNITSDKETGIGNWTEEQIFQTIRTMTKPDGKMINPPMLLLQGGWAQMDEKDLRAVAAYIKQLPPVKNKVTDSTFKFAPPGPPPAGSGAPHGGPPPAGPPPPAKQG